MTISIIQYKWDAKKKRINKLFEFVGKNTLTIFVINPIIILILELATKNIQLQTDYTALNFLLSFLNVGIVFILCISAVKTKNSYNIVFDIVKKTKKLLKDMIAFKY